MGARVLIVEDEEALTLLLRYNLEAEGYDVENIARIHIGGAVLPFRSSRHSGSLLLSGKVARRG